MPPRLVLLRHDVPADFGRPSHWDLLLERADDCWTWALEELPAGLDAGTGLTRVPAIRLANHRKHYLEYEGSVSRSRGEVTRVLSGNYQLVSHSDERVEVVATFEGERVRMVLEEGEGQKWILQIPSA